MVLNYVLLKKGALSAHTLTLKAISKGGTSHYCPCHYIGQVFFIWPQLAARNAGEDSLSFGEYDQQISYYYGGKERKECEVTIEISATTSEVKSKCMILSNVCSGK